MKLEMGMMVWQMYGSSLKRNTYVFPFIELYSPFNKELFVWNKRRKCSKNILRVFTLFWKKTT